MLPACCVCNVCVCVCVCASVCCMDHPKFFMFVVKCNEYLCHTTSDRTRHSTDKQIHCNINVIHLQPHSTHMCDITKPISNHTVKLYVPMQQT